MGIARRQDLVFWLGHGLLPLLGWKALPTPYR